MVDLDAHEQGDIRDAEEHYAMEHPPENYVKLTMLMAVEKERDALRAEVARLREAAEDVLSGVYFSEDCGSYPVKERYLLALKAALDAVKGGAHESAT